MTETDGKELQEALERCREKLGLDFSISDENSAHLLILLFFFRILIFVGFSESNNPDLDFASNRVWLWLIRISSYHTLRSNIPLERQVLEINLL